MVAANVFGVLFLLVAIFCGARVLPNRENFHPKILTFRPVYGIFLFAVYFQLLSMGVGWLVCRFTIGSVAASKLILPIGVTGMLCGYFVGLYLFLLRRVPLKISQLLSLDAKITDYPRLITTGFGTFCVLVLADTLWTVSTSKFIHNTTSNPVSAQLISWSNEPSIGTALFSFAAVGFLAPLGEEIVFRALLYGWLRKRFAVAPAVVISGLVFALFHADPGQIVQLTLAGVLFALVFERTRSLVPTVVAHACMNSTSIISILLLGAAGAR